MFQWGIQRREGDRIALPQDVALVGHPQVEHAAEHEHHLHVRVVRTRLLAGPAARFDRRQDHLQAPRHVRGQELIDGLGTRVGDPPARLAPDHAAR